MTADKELFLERKGDFPAAPGVVEPPLSPEEPTTPILPFSDSRRLNFLHHGFVDLKKNYGPCVNVGDKQMISALLEFKPAGMSGWDVKTSLKWR